MSGTMKKLVSSRGILKAHLTRFIMFLTNVGLRDGVIALETRLQKIEPLFDRFDEIQSAIENTADASELSESETVRAQLKNSYYDAVTKARLLLQQNAQNSNRDNHDPEHENANFADRPQLGVKLPVIKIPSFDGSHERWIKFRDTFQSMIDDNQSLTNMQKFHYLDSSISGDAAYAIAALGISSENYPTAWTTLKERFEDPKALSHFHVKGLFELPTMVKDSHKSLRQLIDNASNHLLSLKNMGEDVDTWDSMIVYLLATKLDAYTKREWDRKALQLRDKPTFKEMSAFLNAHCKYLERSDNDKPQIRNQPISPMIKSGRSFQKSRAENLSANVTQNVNCPVCDKPHNIYHCEEFIKLPVTSKISEVQEHKLYFNCLRPAHQSKDCKSGHCRKCSERHNTLLHRDESYQETPARANTSNNASTVHNEGVSNVCCNHAQKRETPVILATAMVRIQDGQGITQECRALSDGGAQSHFVTHDLCNRLNLKRIPTNQPVSGIGQHQTNLRFKTQISIKSKYNAFCANVTCLVISSIPGDMPNVAIDLTDLKVPKNLTLADPQFYEPRPIDLLIGAEIFWGLLCIGQIPLGPTLPIMQNTKFGWVLGGPMEMPTQKRENPARHCHLVKTQQLHDQDARFWSLEECSSTQAPKGKPEDSICEDYFRTTTTRNDDGRFVVSIPFRETLQDLGQSREQAHRRLLSIERKLQKDASLANDYQKFMEDYEDTGHMSKLPSGNLEEEKTAYYLPHHAVRKEGSTTTKVRVVFDGSAKTSTGLSINDVQYVGPVVQDDLFSILLRFRKIFEIGSINS